MKFIGNEQQETVKLITTNTTVSSSAAIVVNNSISPSEYIQSCLPRRKRKLTFHGAVSPSEERMDAYTMEAVKAIRSRDVDKMRKMLTEEDQSFDACNSNGESLLHLACRRGDLATVRFLVDEAKVPLDVQDSMGRTVFHDACWRPTPNMPLMEFLILGMNNKTTTMITTADMLLMEDVRGHTCFDYCRKQHWKQWVDFLKENRDLIQAHDEEVSA